MIATLPRRAVPEVPEITLRCHHCSHAVGTTVVPMQLAGIFKASRMGRVGRSHLGEVRRRCSSCGWVNVFHPVKHTAAIETK